MTDYSKPSIDELIDDIYAAVAEIHNYEIIRHERMKELQANLSEIRAEIKRRCEASGALTKQLDQGKGAPWA